MRALLLLGLLSLLAMGRPPTVKHSLTVQPPRAVPVTLQTKRWDAATIRPEWALRVRSVAKEARRNEWRYAAVSRETSVPWWAIAGIHNMEASQSFNKHLHEGSPLTGRTKWVPKGRPLTGEPPFTWEESAEDALAYDGMGKVKWADQTAALDALERYNGTGYKRYHPDVPTPYLWSGTTVYTQGKYIADGKWSATAVSQQVGICALLKELGEPGWY